MAAETNNGIGNETELRRQASQRAKVKMSFYSHTIIFLVVNLLLLVIDAMTGPGWWFYWGLFGWGIGLVAHGCGVFVPAGGKALLRRMEEREYQRLVKAQE